MQQKTSPSSPQYLRGRAVRARTLSSQIDFVHKRGEKGWPRVTQKAAQSDEGRREQWSQGLAMAVEREGHRRRMPWGAQVIGFGYGGREGRPQEEDAVGSRGHRVWPMAAMVAQGLRGFYQRPPCFEIFFHIKQQDTKKNIICSRICYPQ